MKLNINECQMLQGRNLIKYAYVASMEINNKEKDVLDAETEAVGYMTGKKAILWSNSYYGDDAINLKNDCVTMQYEEYIVNVLVKDIDVNNISKSDMNDYIWPIVIDR